MSKSSIVLFQASIPTEKSSITMQKAASAKKERSLPRPKCVVDHVHNIRVTRQPGEDNLFECSFITSTERKTPSSNVIRRECTQAKYKTVGDQFTHSGDVSDLKRMGRAKASYRAGQRG